MNYYLLLGVAKDATAETIRSAFRALARRYHPDAGEGASADRFREILIAYETLNDPARRAHYDRSLQIRPTPTAPFVEPLSEKAAPEPMISRRTGIVRTNSVHEPLWPTRLDELFDELFQSWDAIFFGAPRRRDRR
jgi:curved DNA-binding protein CbpA